MAPMMIAVPVVVAGTREARLALAPFQPCHPGCFVCAKHAILELVEMTEFAIRHLDLVA